MNRALAGVVVVLALASPPVAFGAEKTFTQLPWTQSWTAPPHVTSATIDVYGAQGATSIYFPETRGGLGGHVSATIDVVPGHGYSIDVGERGRWNGDPFDFTTEGGEGSEVRSGATRLIAAGGGGGGSGTDGGPGGTEGPDYQGGIDGDPGAVVNGTTISGPGAGGVSYGPPGTVYEVGVRSGDGLVTVSYDPFPQDTLIKSGPDGLTNDNTPTFSFASNEAGVSFQCFDEFTFGACSGPRHTHTIKTLSDGAHKFAVTSTDSAGNSDPTPAIRRFRVDTQPPVFRVTDRPKNTVTTKRKRVKVRVSFASNEPRTTFRCRLDTAAYRRCDSPYSARARAQGRRGLKHRISVRAVDAAGNVTAPTVLKFKAMRKR